MDVACPKHVNMKLPKNGHKALGGDHPNHRVVCMMPHPPPHIWACPCDRSLQLLYLSAVYYNRCTLLQIYKCRAYAALTPCHLRVPLPLTPLRALEPLSPSATHAHMGSNVLGSGHQLWHWNLTLGHRRRDVPPLP